MPSTLDVVNNCLATMGEVPLTTLNEPHAFKSAALRYLDRADKATQGRSWWFNTEELTLTPAPSTGHMTLPGDTIKVATGFKSLINGRQTTHNPRYVQRGSRMYDLVERTFTITEDELEVQIIRQVPLTDLPQVAADYINDLTVFRFQSHYDGDTAKRRELEQTLGAAWVELRSENIRQSRYNAIHSNPTLARLKAITNSSHYVRGR